MVNSILESSFSLQEVDSDEKGDRDFRVERPLYRKKRASYQLMLNDIVMKTNLILVLTT